MKKYFIKYGETYLGKDYNSFTPKQHRAYSFPIDKRTADIEHFRFTVQQNISDCYDQCIADITHTIQKWSQVKLTNLRSESLRLKGLLRKIKKSKIIAEDIQIEFFSTNKNQTKITWSKPKNTGSKNSCSMCGVWLDDVKYLNIVHLQTNIYFCPFCVEILGLQAPQIIETINSEIHDLYKTNKFIKDL